MDNTVGSRGIISLTTKQNAIVVGKILGDGTLEKNGKYSRLRICQSVKQKDYVYWVHEELKPFVTNKIRISKQRSYRKATNQLRFDTYSLPIFEEYRKAFYEGRKKVIPSSIENLITDPITLAVWYMDDGYKRTDNSGLYLCTSSFTDMENLVLKNCLYKNFEIDTNIHYAGGYAILHIPSRSVLNFSNLIKKYLVKSMLYKVPLTP